jgi:glyoxylase I family protein
VAGGAIASAAHLLNFGMACRTLGTGHGAMGGDDSQKLLPWRGMILLSGAQTSGSFRLQHCSGKLRDKALVAQRASSRTASDCSVLHFHLDMQNLPAFGQVSIDSLKLILSGPGASESRPMPDGRQQEPGGWNRVVLQVKDLPALIADLKKAKVRFRNQMEFGPGGKQVQVEDPDGNPIELFEPGRH